MGRMSYVFVSQRCLPRGNLKPHILILSVISSHFHRQHLVLIIERYSHRCSIKILAFPSKENKISNGLQQPSGIYDSKKLLLDTAARDPLPRVFRGGRKPAPRESSSELSIRKGRGPLRVHF